MLSAQRTVTELGALPAGQRLAHLPADYGLLAPDPEGRPQPFLSHASPSGHADPELPPQPCRDPVHWCVSPSGKKMGSGRANPPETTGAPPPAWPCPRCPRQRLGGCQSLACTRVHVWGLDTGQQLHSVRTRHGVGRALMSPRHPKPIHGQQSSGGPPGHHIHPQRLFLPLPQPHFWTRFVLSAHTPCFHHLLCFVLGTSISPEIRSLQPPGCLLPASRTHHQSRSH